MKQALLYNEGYIRTNHFVCDIIFITQNSHYHNAKNNVILITIMWEKNHKGVKGRVGNS